MNRGNASLLGLVRLPSVKESVVVTGSSSGIGLAVATLLLSKGFAVTLHGLDKAEVQTAFQKLDDGTKRLAAHYGDLSDPDTADQLFSTAVSHFGTLNHIVCAAGLQTYGAATTPPEDDLRLALEVNVMGTFNPIRSSIESIRLNRGSITVVSSSQASRTQENVVGYTTSKSALNGMVRALAVDEAKFGVRVNAVLPGAIDTPMLRESARLFGNGSVEDTLRGWGHAHPLGTVGDASDVAHACAFLLSGEAKFITGTELFVDGGLTVRSAVHLTP